MTETASEGGAGRPAADAWTAAAPDAAGADAWKGAVDRFAAWLADFSPFYRQLRISVPVPPDAPARLAYFWRTVGWAPGIGLAYDGWGTPPVRELGRAEADRAFRRWLGAECFAPTMQLPEPTVQALWDRLPKRCWVLRAHVETYHSRGGRCHGGGLDYIDEDAGDDPPMMEWITSGGRHDTGAASPTQACGSAVAYLMGTTIAMIARRYGVSHDLPVPAEPGPFAPVFPCLWRLGEGVWGMPDPTYCDVGQILADAGPATRVGKIIYRSAREYLQFVADLPAEHLTGWSTDIAGTHEIKVVDARALAPARLAERGLTYVERPHGSMAIGRLDGIPLEAYQFGDGSAPGSTSFTVAQEDYRALRDLLEREQVEVRDQSWTPGAHWWAAPDAATVERAARLTERIELATSRLPSPGTGASVSAAEPVSAAASTPAGEAVSAGAPVARGDDAVVATVASDPAAEAAVRAEAAALRAWVLAANPGLELTTPELAADEPPLVRALWEGLGYNDEFEEMIGRPDRASSERELAAMLEVYRARGGYELERASLPKRLRAVWVDGDNDSNLLVTDEDGPHDDPPMLGVDAEEGEAEPIEEFSSYIAWVGEQIAWYAGEGQATLSVRTTPPLSELGTQAYPRLAPAIRGLAPGIWASPQTSSAVIGAPRFRDLIAWLAQTTLVDRLELTSHYPLRKLTATIGLSGFTPPDGLRRWQAPSGEALCYAGTVDGVPILVKVADRIVLYTSHADRKRAETIAAAAGWI